MSIQLYDYLHEALDKVDHISTIEAFYHQFHAIKSLLSTSQPAIPEAYFATRFIYGLLPQFQNFIIPFQPTTVMAAYRLALIFEESIYLDYFPENEVLNYDVGEGVLDTDFPSESTIVEDSTESNQGEGDPIDSIVIVSAILQQNLDIPDALEVVTGHQSISSTGVSPSISSGEDIHLFSLVGNVELRVIRDVRTNKEPVGESPIFENAHNNALAFSVVKEPKVHPPDVSTTRGNSYCSLCILSETAGSVSIYSSAFILALDSVLTVVGERLDSEHHPNDILFVRVEEGVVEILNGGVAVASPIQDVVNLVVLVAGQRSDTGSPNVILAEGRVTSYRPASRQDIVPAKVNAVETYVYAVEVRLPANEISPRVLPFSRGRPPPLMVFSFYKNVRWSIKGNDIAKVFPKGVFKLHDMTKSSFNFAEGESSNVGWTEVLSHLLNGGTKQTTLLHMVGYLSAAAPWKFIRKDLVSTQPLTFRFRHLYILIYDMLLVFTKATNNNVCKEDPTTAGEAINSFDAVTHFARFNDLGGNVIIK